MIWSLLVGGLGLALGQPDTASASLWSEDGLQGLPS